MSKTTRTWTLNPFISNPPSSDANNSRERHTTSVPTIEEHFPRIRYQPHEMINGRPKNSNMSGRSESQVVVNSVIEILERDKHDLELDLRDTTDYCQRLQAKLDAANLALEASQKDATKYKDELDDMNRKHDQCEKYHIPTLNKLMEELGEVRLAGANGKAAIQARLNDTEGRLNETIRDFSALQNKHQQILELLQVRSNHLREAEYFLGKLDNISDDQVIPIIEDINANVSSIAVDVVHHFGSSLSMNGNELSVPKLSTSIGDHFLETLRTFEHRHDTSLVEWALRSEICYQIYDVFNCWDDTSTEFDQHIQGIHEKMRKEEPQTISARWRSLTCRYNSYQTLKVRDRVAYTVRKITEILFISGAPIQPPHLEAQCKEYFGTALTELWSAVFQAVNKFRENIISSDYFVEVVRAEEEFKPYRMQPQGVDPTKDPSDIYPCAVCTVALGLRRSRHVDGGGGDEKGKLEEMYILKTSIVLPSDVMHVKEAYGMVVAAATTPLPLAIESSQHGSQENRSVPEHQTPQANTPTERIPLSIPPPPPFPAGARIATTPTPSQPSEVTHGAGRHTTRTGSAPASAPISKMPGSWINSANSTKSPPANKAPGESSNGTGSRSSPSSASRAKNLQTSTSGKCMQVVALSSRTTGPRPKSSSIQPTATFHPRWPVTSASESLATRQPGNNVGNANNSADTRGQVEQTSNSKRTASLPSDLTPIRQSSVPTTTTFSLQNPLAPGGSSSDQHSQLANSESDSKGRSIPPTPTSADPLSAPPMSDTVSHPSTSTAGTSSNAIHNQPPDNTAADSASTEHGPQASPDQGKTNPTIATPDHATSSSSNSQSQPRQDDSETAAQGGADAEAAARYQANLMNLLMAEIRGF